MKRNAQNLKFLLALIAIFIHLMSVSQILQGSFESKFKRYEKNEPFTETTTLEWSTVAWKGERIHRQIVLWSDANINGLSYTIGEFLNEKGAILNPNANLRFGHYVKGDPEARSCSGYPSHPGFVEIIDALSNEEIIELNVSDPMKLWLTMAIPPSTPAGKYTGTVTVNGGNEPLVFKISVQVVNYTLPEAADWEFHLDIWQFPLNLLDHYNTANPAANVVPWSDEHFALLRPFYSLLADAGQKAITAYIKDGALGADSMVRWTKKADHSWEYDFTAFDTYVSTLMSWGITQQINCFSPVGWNEETIPYWDETTNSKLSLNAPLGSTTYNERWNDFLNAFKAHLDNKGWFDRTVLYLDEVSETKLNHVTSIVRSNNPNWKLGIAYSHGLSNTSKASFYDMSGILEDASNAGISDYKISTFYTSCTQTRPNNYITPENSPAEMTWMAWHAFKEGFDGYLRWAFDYWSQSEPLDARDGGHTAGDFSMVYRASNNAPSEVLSSIRFEMLRDGIQDFEKLRILKRSLEASTDPIDKQLLEELVLTISKFGKASGIDAEQLILEGQKVIAAIVDRTFNIKADNFTIVSSGETCPGKGNGQLHITSKKPYNFEVALEEETYSFTTALTVENLKPNNYTLCITSPYEPSFEQCYGFAVSKAPEISTKTTIYEENGISKALISLIEGSPPFSISINNNVVAQTTNRSHELVVEHGDLLNITTAEPCQGTFSQIITLANDLLFYPNPTEENINLIIRNVDTPNVPVTIFNLQNKMVSAQKRSIKNNVVSISVAELPSGMYMVRVGLKNPRFLKIIKK